MSDGLAAILGLVLIVATLQDAFEVVLLPRRVDRKHRFVHYFYRLTWAAWSRLGALLRRGSARESLLSVYGPMSMVLLFVIWGVGLIFGFGFLQYALQGGTGHELNASLTHQLYMSGDAFLRSGPKRRLPTPRRLTYSCS